METWARRVETYMDQLQGLVDEVDVIFEQANVDPSKLDPISVQESTANLQEKLSSMEQKVADREELLRADGAPSGGLTLYDKLSDSNEFELAERADRLADQISLTHQRAMSRFVCQFHLSNLTTDLVRILTGSDGPATYGGPGTTPIVPQGGLFNESA